MKRYKLWPAAVAVFLFAGCAGANSLPPSPVAGALDRLAPAASPVLYVADAWGKAVERVSGSGAVKKIGSGWSQPWAVACDGKGNVYVADSWANKVVKIAGNGTMTEIKPGVFGGPAGVVADGRGNLYVATYVNGWTGGAIAKISANGTLTRIGKSLKMTEPRAIAIDDLGYLYVVDPHWTSIAKVAPNGAISHVGSGFYFPTGVAVDRLRNVYVVNGRGDLYKVSPKGVKKRIAASYVGQPVGIAVDSALNVYIADTFFRGIQRITPSGSIGSVGSGIAGAYGVAVQP